VLNQEEKFFDGFMLLLGVLIGAIAGIVLFADFVGDEAAARDAEAEVSADALIEERIRPIGQVALLGDPDIGVAPTLAIAVDVESVRGPLSGPQVYDDNCYLCHAAPGIGGAPVFGDADAWMPRIAQGADILQDHVLNGYQGEVGVMPPKGGRLDLSDAEIIEAIDFMLQAVQ
jgi:cytochrome c5